MNNRNNRKHISNSSSERNNSKKFENSNNSNNRNFCNNDRSNNRSHSYACQVEEGCFSSPKAAALLSPLGK